MSYVPSDFRVSTIPSGTRLARIYNYIEAAATGRRVTAFNSKAWKLVPANKHAGGRFDTLEPDTHSYMYLGETLSDAKVAVWERLARKRFLPLTGSGPQIISGKMWTDYAIRYFMTTSDLEVVDLTDNAAMSFFGGKAADITENINYNQTRQWARYIRKWTISCAGFLYMPHQLATPAYGYSLVLFNDRCPKRPVAPVGRSIPLTSRKGRRIVEAAFDGSCIQVQWS